MNYHSELKMEQELIAYPLITTQYENIFSNFELDLSWLLPKNVVLDNYDEVRAYHRLSYDCFTAIPIVFQKLKTLLLHQFNCFQLVIHNGFLIIIHKDQSVHNLMKQASPKQLFTKNIGWIVFDSAILQNHPYSQAVALVLAMNKEFLPFIQKIICAIHNIQHKNSKEYLDANLNVGTEIKVPIFSDDMKSFSFETYKIIGKNYLFNRTQESEKFETITCKNVSTNSRKKVRFAIYEQPFNFCF